MSNLTLILLTLPIYLSFDKHFINDLKLTVILARIPSLYIDLSVTNNYKGIRLTCIMAKIFNRLLLNCISEILDLKLRKNQNGCEQKQRQYLKHLPYKESLKG